MALFDPNEKSYIKGQIDEELMLPEIGRIVEVHEHHTDDDLINFEADIILRDEDSRRRGVPISTEHRGIITIPTSPDGGEDDEPDLAVVNFLDGDSNRPIITDVLYNDIDRPPKGVEGLYRHRTGNIYFDAHPEGKYMQFSYKEADDHAPLRSIGIYDDDPEDDEVRPEIRHRDQGYEYGEGDMFNWSEYVLQFEEPEYVLGRLTMEENDVIGITSMSLSDEEGLNPENLYIDVRKVGETQPDVSIFAQDPGAPANSGWPGERPVRVTRSYESDNISTDRLKGEPLYEIRWDEFYNGESEPLPVEIVIVNEAGAQKVHASVEGFLGSYDPDVEYEDQYGEDYII